jgi:glucokinase
MPPVIAVDLGATHIRAGLVSPEGRIILKFTIRTPTEGESGRVVTDRISALVGRLLACPEGHGAAALGISSAGPLDLPNGAVVRSPNMAFPEIPLVQPLEEQFSLPVRLINDCRAGVLGERLCGAARGCDNVVYITFSSGIGGGAVVNGTLLLGQDGNAGEIGHFIVDGKYGLTCGCGNRGHWEAYASGTHLSRFFSAWREAEGICEPAFHATTPEGIFAAAHAGDPVAAAFMEELGRINARGISNVIVAYNPAMIVLDGPIARCHGRLLLANLEPRLDSYLSAPQIVISTLNGDAPLLGAAAVALGTLE